MKTKLLLLFFIAFTARAQRPQLHLVLAADVEDNAYTVRNFSKEEKIKSMFELVSKELDFELKIKYLHTQKYGFSAKGVLDTLGNLKILTRDDILVFYYLGRGFYPKPTTKVPLLEFQDTKKMLSFDQIRKKVSTLKTRLTLLVADCDETYSLLYPQVLPHSLLKTVFLPPDVDGIQTSSFDNQFLIENLDVSGFHENQVLKKYSLDSLYRDNCLAQLQAMLSTHNINDLEKKWHTSVLINRLSSYVTQPISTYSSFEDRYRLEQILEIAPRKYRTQSISEYDMEILVDSLFRKQKILDFDDTLNLKIREFYLFENKPMVSTFWDTESPEMIAYCLETLNELNRLIAAFIPNKPLQLPQQRLKIIYNRLESYKKYGFPNTSENSTNYRSTQIIKLPIVPLTNYKLTNFGHEDLAVLVDSIFLKKQLLNNSEPLFQKLDSLIDYANRPQISPLELLSEKEIDKYYITLDSLEGYLDLKSALKMDTSLTRRLKIFHGRLENYRKIGFPNKNIVDLKALGILKEESITSIVDVLYNSGNLLKFKNPLQSKLDSVIENKLSYHTLLLSKEEWNYYLSILKSLDSLKIINVEDYEKSISIQLAKNRLLQYPEFGFPDKKKNYQIEINNIEKHTYGYINEVDRNDRRNKYYNPIIDSLYRSHQILNILSPLYRKIHELIRADLPKGYPIREGMQARESYLRPIVNQLFLSECGIIEVASGHSKTLQKNKYIGNFTDQVYKNFNNVISNTALNDVGQLSLSKIFTPLSKPFIFDYKRAIPVMCNLVSTTPQFLLPDFKKLPTEARVNELFMDYVRTTSLPKKKVLKNEISGYFERGSVLKVKPPKSNSNTISSSSSIGLEEYFQKLDRARPKIDSVEVREGSLRRNKNFSKITSMMLVEN